jgi:putative redox protein
MTNEITLTYNKSFNAELKLPDESSLTIGAPCQDGKPEALSPKDLFAASYGSCAIMVMDIVSKKAGFDITGANITVSPVWAQDGSQLAEVNATVVLPSQLSAEQLDILQKGAHRCPVHSSLRPEIKTTFTFEVA